MLIKQAEIKITGLVQGVFFRQAVKTEAAGLGLTGWVRNEADGSVLVVVEGEEDKLQELVRWCKKGTELSKIENVEVEWKQGGGKFSDFLVR